MDAPIAFDFSQTDHPTAQNQMWNRIVKVADGLIRMLKHPTLARMDDGSTMWEHSLIYVATDFGRSKERPSGAVSFGTGHDLINGSLLISPLLQGNSVYGGVDAANCQTHSYNLATGMADPALAMSNESRNEDLVMREGHVFSLVCQALGIDFPGRIDMSPMVRS